MATLITNPIRPTREGASILLRWLRHAESDSWPRTGCIERWLLDNDLDKDTDLVAILAPHFGGEEPAGRVLRSVAARDLVVGSGNGAVHFARKGLAKLLRTIAYRDDDASREERLAAALDDCASCCLDNAADRQRVLAAVVEASRPPKLRVLYDVDDGMLVVGDDIEIRVSDLPKHDPAHVLKLLREHGCAIEYEEHV